MSLTKIYMQCLPLEDGQTMYSSCDMDFANSYKIGEYDGKDIVLIANGTHTSELAACECFLAVGWADLEANYPAIAAVCVDIDFAGEEHG